MKLSEKTMQFASVSSYESTCIHLMRVFLMIFVFMGHLNWMAFQHLLAIINGDVSFYWAIPFKIVFRYGREAAYLFILLSGFFVGADILREYIETRSIDLKCFFLKKFLRIYPTLVAALLVTLVLDFTAIHLLGLSNFYKTIDNNDINTTFTVSVFLKNIICLEPTFSESFGTNGALWTLGYIVQYYLVGAISMWLYSKLPSKITIVGICLCIGVFFWSKPEFLRLLGLWIFGAILRFFPLKLKFQKLAFLGGCMLIVVANSLHFIFTDGSQLVHTLFIGSAGTLFLISFRSVTINFNVNTISKIKNYAILTYPFYATHMPVIIFLRSFFSSSFSPLMTVIYILFAIIISYLVAVMINRLTSMITYNRRVKC